MTPTTIITTSGGWCSRARSTGTSRARPRPFTRARATSSSARSTSGTIWSRWAPRPASASPSTRAASSTATTAPAANPSDVPLRARAPPAPPASGGGSEGGGAPSELLRGRVGGLGDGGRRGGGGDGSAGAGHQAQHGGRELRVQRVADTVAEQVKCEHGDGDREAGEEHQPPVGHETGDRVRQHIAPGGGGRRDADAQEAQGGLDDDRDAQVGGGEDQVGSHALRQDVQGHHAQLRGAGGPPCLDEGHFADAD